MGVLTELEVTPAPTQSDGDVHVRPAANEVSRLLGASVVGAGIALSGFAPLNDIPGRLYVGALPGFALLTPAVLLAALALWLSRDASAAHPVPVLIAVLLFLVGLGAFLSITASPHPAQSIAYLVLGVLAPACVFVAVRRGHLPATVLVGSFLAALSLALLWADLVFLRQNGLPTPTALFAAKFSQHPHDFHYYTFGNPDHTATFLLMPVTACLIWVRDQALSRRQRRALICAAGLILFTILLLYVRLPMVIAFAMLLGSILGSRLPPRMRISAVAVAVGGAVVLVVRSPSSYLTHLFSTAHRSSGGVRLGSLTAGLKTLGHHLLTGVGLGQYGSGNGLTAHSSVIQAGAEMGLVGLLGIALITIALPVAAIVVARRHPRDVLKIATLSGAAVYAVAAAVSGGADAGLFVGLVSVYGLTLALFAGVGLAKQNPSFSTSLAGAISTALELTGAWLRRQGHEWRGRPGWAWVAYGLAWVPLAALIARSRISPVVAIQGTQLAQLKLLLLAHQHGFGPMVEMHGPNTFVPAGLSYDQGPYLVTPWLSGLLHTTNIDTITRTSFVAALVVIIASYPVAVHRLTGSRLAALASPVLALAFFGFFFSVTIFNYWTPAAVMALCLPWLLVFVRERSAPIGALTLIAVIAGATQTFRSGTGLGLALGCVVVCLLADASRRRKAVAIVLTALAFLCFSTGVIDLAIQARAHRMGSYPVNTQGVAGVNTWAEESGHPLWHTAYIGLGVIPNPYGIVYKDAAGAAYVRTVDPLAPFVSPRYESILRDRVIHITLSNPGFVLRAEQRKLGETLADGASRFWPLFIIIPLALLLGLGRRRRMRYAAVVAPIAIFAILPPLVAIARYEYELPWFGLLATIGILCSCWMLAAVGASIASADGVLRRHPSANTLLRAGARWSRRREALLAAAERRLRIVAQPLVNAGSVGKRGIKAALSAGTRTVKAAASSAAGVATMVSDPATKRALAKLVRSRSLYVALAVVAAGLAARAYLTSWEHSVHPPGAAAVTQTAGLPFDVSLPPPVEAWDPATTLRDWTVEPRTRAAPVGATVSVITTARDNAYQLAMPAVTLPAGRYVAAVRGEIQSGGMEVGVLDVRADKWIHISSYGSAKPSRRTTMTDDFTLPTARRVQVILSNFAPSGGVSRWSLNQILIAPRGGSGPATPAPGGSLPRLSLPPPTRPTPGLPFNAALPPPIKAWDAATIRHGWSLEPGTRARQLDATVSVSTTPRNNAYQLAAPVVSLPAGKYVAAVRGEVQSGGIEVGVLDPGRNRWIQVASYGSGRPPTRATLTNDFTLTRAQRVEVILSNFAPSGGSSTWSLNQVLIAPQSTSHR